MPLQHPRQLPDKLTLEVRCPSDKVGYELQMAECMVAEFAVGMNKLGS